MLPDTQFLHTEHIKPGALVRSIGRTSGYQLGQISRTAGWISFGKYTTEEWCVLKRQDTTVNDWIEGGIGVDGDSGALIVDAATEAVYGMLWGRHGDGATTVTLFTPMNEILADIKEMTGASTVEILLGQNLPPPPTFHERDMLSFSSSIQTTPLSVGSNDIRFLGGEQPRSQNFRSFERYRRPEGTHGTTEIETTERGDVEDDDRWPGSHTYFRYAVAPDQE